jgi:hypothetical protein
LRDACAASATQHMDSLGKARPELPPWLTNRAAEVSRALLAIADEIGGDWPARARAASRALGTGGDQHDDAPDLVMLLGDIREAFGEHQTIFTETLLRKLNAIEEHPWGARRRGEGLDPRGLSRMLRPFGIKSRTIGSGKDSAKGYRFDDFIDAFDRHLARPSQASQASHVNADGTGDATDATDATDSPGLGSDGEPPAGRNGRRTVADLTDAEPLSMFPGSRFLEPDEPINAGDAPHDPWCGYPARHAGRSWRTRDGGLVCGVCHPPASPDLMADAA